MSEHANARGPGAARPGNATPQAAARLQAAERRLFSACGLQITSRRVRLADPPLAVRVIEAGEGPPLLLVPGSGMSASTWAPLMPYLPGYRLIALDLPGFGLSDSLDYAGRALREHAVAQLSSLLDALQLERVAVVGTSLGGMWALCLAIHAPHRVTALASLGVPAVALAGMHGDRFLTALSTPGLRHLVARIGSASVTTTRRALARGAIGPHAAKLAPAGFFEVVHEGMRQPGYRTAMQSHIWLAMRRGEPRPQNVLHESELRQLVTPTLMIWDRATPVAARTSAAAPPQSCNTPTSRSSRVATPPSSTTHGTAARSSSNCSGQHEPPPPLPHVILAQYKRPTIRLSTDHHDNHHFSLEHDSQPVLDASTDPPRTPFPDDGEMGAGPAAQASSPAAPVHQTARGSSPGAVAAHRYAGAVLWSDGAIRRRLRPTGRVPGETTTSLLGGQLTAALSHAEVHETVDPEPSVRVQDREHARRVRIARCSRSDSGGERVSQRPCTARRYGATVANVYPPFEGKTPELVIPGDIHPNDAGYAVIAHRFQGALTRPLHDHGMRRTAIS